MNEKETKQDRVILDSKGRKLFDTWVHHRDPKTGKVIEVTPYTLTIDNGIKIYTDRATGKKYFQNGTPYNPPKAARQEAKKLGAIQGSSSDEIESDQDKQ